MIPTIIIPDARPGAIKPQEAREEFLRRWHEDYEAGRETLPPPENVRHVHNEDWQSFALSPTFIRAASKGEHFDRPAGWLWFGMWFLYTLAAAAWAIPLGRQIGFFIHG